MAQQIIPAAQLIPKFQRIRRCNNYALLQSISCSPECKIVGQILLDHPLSYALTATADVSVTMLKVFNRCLTTRTSGKDQTKINILQLFHVVVNRVHVDYAALLWTPPSAHRSLTLTTASPQMKKRKKVSGETSSPQKLLKPGSHKENPKLIDDDDDVNDDEQKDKKNDDIGTHEIGSLENRTEKRQTSIPTPPRSPRINLSSDMNIVSKLTDTVSPSTTTTSKDPQKETHISSKYSHLPGALRRMCRHQGYMIRDME
ncbi:hypothetical protein Tco_1533202 [Tanacetum coccineum]